MITRANIRRQLRASGGITNAISRKDYSMGGSIGGGIIQGNPMGTRTGYFNPFKIVKKGLKKVAKPAALLGAAYLASKGLGRKKENKAFLKTEGGDKSDMRDYGPFSKGTRRIYPKDNSPLITDDGFITENNMYGEGAAKKGGRMVQTRSGGGAVKRRIKTSSKTKSSGKALRGYGKEIR